MLRKLLYLSAAVILAYGCTKECPECENEECEIDECASADLTRGLIAYYPFSGNANDASGNGNHAVAMNGAGFGTDFLGRPNSAASFDGINDYFIVSDNGKLNTDSQTIAAMVMVKTTNRRHNILARTEFATAKSTAWGIGQAYGVNNRWDYSVPSSTENCDLQHSSIPGITTSASDETIAGRWYQIICTFGDGLQRIYVDGVLKATLQRDFLSLKKCANAQLIIGGWWANDIVSIDGKIDEVRIYNRVLSTCEIDELSEVFRSGSGPK